MIGRAAYRNPWLLSQVDSRLYSSKDKFENRFDALNAFIPYVQKQLSRGKRLARIVRHITGIFQGEWGGKKFRCYLSEKSRRADANINILIEAIELVQNYQCKGQEQ